MTLVKQKGNMYEFVTHMWSPIKGKCSHDCSYCYMKNPRWDLGELRLNEKDLRNGLGENNVIFVGHTIDMFANDVPREWISKVLERCRFYDKNRYLFQSKNPDRIIYFVNELPSDVFIGTTIETNRTCYCESKAPYYPDRARALGKLSKMGYETIVTVEPILDFDVIELVELIKIAKPKWVNIGADSKKHNLPEPPKEKIVNLVEVLQFHTEIKLKQNLNRILKEINDD